MFQSTEWKPGDATRLIEFHKRYTPEPPALADLLQYEARAAAFFAAHRSDQDARCKACGVEYLRGELSADGLCRHCADELGAACGYTFVEVKNFTQTAPADVLPLGIEGVISGRSTCDGSRYRVTWFDRRRWIIRHKWVTQGVIEVIGAASSATVTAPATVTLSAKRK